MVPPRWPCIVDTAGPGAGSRRRVDLPEPATVLREEDLVRYPREEEKDLEVCASLGVDIVWAPSIDQVYPPGVAVHEPDPGPVGELFEGASRPGHLRGVLTVVHRLFDVTGPCVAYFGDKDAQQLFLVRRMVLDEALPVEIVRCPTVRAPDGLALSSRNGLLLPTSASRRVACSSGSRKLLRSRARASGCPRPDRRARARSGRDATRSVGLRRGGRRRHLPAARRARPPARAIVAASFPSARLIDNLALPAAAS